LEIFLGDKMKKIALSAMVSRSWQVRKKTATLTTLQTGLLQKNCRRQEKKYSPVLFLYIVVIVSVEPAFIVFHSLFERADSLVGIKTRGLAAWQGMNSSKDFMLFL
jgi:hypothetical protein